MMKIKSSKMIHPQEIEVWYVIPAIRRELAKEMKNRGMGQMEISEILGVTEAAVSQYLSNKRAAEIKFDKGLKHEIQEAVDNIMNESEEGHRTAVMIEIQKIMNIPKLRDKICKMHKECKGVQENCKLCREK